jgi:3-carboxy-cis,cis-muconate cycloisomerase
MFDLIFGAPDVLAATDDRAWVRALLDVEAALARAGEAVGMVPAEAARAITRACADDLIDARTLALAAVDSATPVIALVDAVRAAVPAEAVGYVHAGATSQDVVDTAMMLVVHRALVPIDADLAGCLSLLTGLTAQYRDTPQIGRTLLQQAEPTTFATTCADWLAALGYARAGLSRLTPAVQLGGAVGTRAAFDGYGAAVAAHLADELGLADAPPWHTDRTRVVEIGAALGGVAGTLGKIALDVLLLAQSEVGEVSEDAAGGGRSSSMPHKRYPARAVLVTACAHRVPGLVGTLFGSMPQELQRAAGRWQAEAPTLTELVRLVGGAAYHAHAMLAHLQVHPDRMAANLRGRASA